MHRTRMPKFIGVKVSRDTFAVDCIVSEGKVATLLFATIFPATSCTGFRQGLDMY